MGRGAVQRQLEQKEAVSLAKLAGAGILSVGRVHLVKDISDTDRADFLLDIPGTRRHSTIQAALNKCRDSAGDYVFVAPQDDNSAWAQTANLDVKGTGEVGRDVHLIGLCAGPNRPEISFAVAKALRIGNGALTGDRSRGCELANLKITSSGTANIHALELGDSSGFTYDTWVHDCEIAQAATTAAKAEIKDFSERAVFERCIIGNPAAHADDNYLQGAGAGGPTIFNDCIFIHYAAATADQFATIVTGALAFFRRCTFYNANHGNFAIATGVVVTSTGIAVLDHCTMLATTMATTSQSFVAPAGVGLKAVSGEQFNPGLAIDGAEPVASDT